jgi:hypothetical protein
MLSRITGIERPTMKIDILFALPGPRHSIQGDKLLVVAAATEHEDPNYLKGVVADVAETALEAGAYRAVHKVTLELDDSLVLALLQGEAVPTAGMTPKARVHGSMLN